MYIKRRKFIQTGSLVTAAALLPNFLKAWEQPFAKGMAEKPKVLVVLQLSGGNDGLNTLIPISNDLYYENRQTIGIAKNKALRLNDDAGIHPALPVLKKMYDEGYLAALNEVGYPNPDRSHFRSMDIWHTASKSNEYLTTGWLGRYLDAQCSGCAHPTQVLEIDDMLSLASKGENHKGIAFVNAERLQKAAKQNLFEGINSVHHDEDEIATYLYKTLADTESSASYIFEKSRMYNSPFTYPNTEIGKGFKNIASLIGSDINTTVYYISHGSFDTHVGQEQQQSRLFKEMNDALDIFIKDLQTMHRFEDVLLFTFSEFGRRVKQNASGGTDHGTANNMFFISGALQQKGIISHMPTLNDLSDGDLQYKIDFRDVYATVLKKWLKADDLALLNHKAKYLSFLG